MLKSYEDGMTYGGEGLHARSKFALENESPAEARSGEAPTGTFPKVSLSDTNPMNTEQESGHYAGVDEKGEKGGAGR